MEKTKAVFCGTVFVLLTVLKMAAPGIAANIRENLQPFFDEGYNLPATAEAIGRNLNRANERFLAVFHSEGGKDESSPQIITASDRQTASKAKYTPVTLAQTIRKFRGDIPYVYHADRLVQNTGETGGDLQAGEESAETKDIPKVVSAFLASQADFADVALPGNVSYEMPEIPFPYSAPIAGAESSGFGYRIHPIDDVLKFHYGTDIAAGEGQSVYAFADGTVIAAAESPGYGNYVMLRHAEGYVTLYGHCSALLVNVGDTVALGSEIAKAGHTGQATGPHLHFEIMHSGTYINPEYYL